MYGLIWHNAALDVLADLYVVADLPVRERMARAVDALNQRLRDDPLDQGESRSGGYRLVFIDYLAVYFHADDAGRMIQVVDVARFGW